MRTALGFREEHTLRDGTHVVLRHIEPTDRDELQHGFEELSAESRAFRFLHPLKRLTPEDLRYLTEVDGRDHVAIVAVDSHNHGLGVARFIRDEADPKVAEAAITVTDAAQGHGLGSLLGVTLARAARERGIERFRGAILPQNLRVRELLHAGGALITTDADGEAVFEIDLRALPLEDGGGLAFFRELLRSLMRAIAVGIRHER